MKFRLLLLLLLTFSAVAQERNTEVRKLNEIVGYMDAFSRINQTAYFDVQKFSQAVFESCEKLRPNFFYTSRTTHSGTVWHTGIEENFRFKELKPTADGQLPSYMSDWIPYLKGREKMNLLVGKIGSQNVQNNLKSYMIAADSLFYKHTELTTYVAEKQFETDTNLDKATQLLKELSNLFETCHAESEKLTLALRNYYDATFPPNRFHAKLKPAEAELRLTVNLINDWQHQLYNGNHSENDAFDKKLRELNLQGLGRDSIYLFGTEGYGYFSSGWWPHTRYRTFYTSMSSSIFWYAGEKIRPQAYETESDLYYNKFINRYHFVIEDYNEFAAIMDGKTFMKEAECCLSPREVDQNENVQLNFPRLLYKYTYFDPCKKQPETVTAAPESGNDDAKLVANAQPHHLVYLLDVSGSMNEKGKLDLLKKSTKYLVGLQSEKHKISAVLFASSENILLENVSCDQKEIIFEKVDNLRANGTTKIKSGVETAAKIAESNKIQDGKTKVILVTDGIFELDKQTKKRISALKDQGISFSVISLNETYGSKYENQLRELCASTNGNFHKVNASTFKNSLLIEATE